MDGQRPPERNERRETFIRAGRRRVAQATGMVIAIAIALTAALAGIVSHTAAGHTSKHPLTSGRTAPPAAPPAADDQQVYPDPNPQQLGQPPQAYGSPGGVVSRSS